MIGTLTVQEANLVGKISSVGQLKGSIITSDVLIGKLSTPVYYDKYEGEYDIIPTRSLQVMDTSDKLMVRDISVQAIPFFKVDNEHNGQTFIIGG